MAILLTTSAKRLDEHRMSWRKQHNALAIALHNNITTRYG